MNFHTLTEQLDSSFSSSTEEKLYYFLFIYRIPMFTHLSVPKVLFFFFTRPCHSSLLPPVLLFSSSSLFPASRNLGSTPSSSPWWTPFPNSSGYSFFWHYSDVSIPISMLICNIVYHRIFLTFISFLITVFLIFSNLECLADLLKKSISIDINFDVKFLFSFQISAPTSDGTSYYTILYL